MRPYRRLYPDQRKLPHLIRWGTLLLALAGRLSADDRTEIFEWIGEVAARLSEDNPAGFMRAFDKRMAGRERLEGNVYALIQTAEVSSSVNLVAVNASGAQTAVELDWFLELRPRAASSPTSRRRRVLRMKLERRNKGWVIVEMDDPDFFAPPPAGPQR